NGHAPGGQRIAAPGQRVPALRVRPLGPAVATDAGPRRRHCRAVCGRHYRGIPAPGGGRAVPGGTARAVRAVQAGAAPGADAAAGVRPVCGREPAARRPGEARDVRLSRLHAYLREEEEQWTVHGAAADDSAEAASEAERGESRAAAAPARPDPAGGRVAAVGHSRASAVLRGADELAGPVHVLLPGGAALVPCSCAA